ncbi:M48 family metalloprotease [Nocardia vinacea]|uniref:M48 family metalloprotease n=1 Tax=Nocardia vinacea TaxID=96468 RepID=A0ABZ1YLS7_9NOCA|nr:M48 family metalloprotease [Nocardia vinacea]
MIASGLFIGDWFYGVLTGEQFVQIVERCLEQAGYTGSFDSLREQITIQDTAMRCYAFAQHTRASYSLGGAILVVLAGTSVVFIAPRIIERRRHLQPVATLLPDTADRVTELAVSAGLQHLPTAMLGDGAQRDAFSYGSPRRHRIAVPRAAAVRWRDQSLFDPLILHELAHLRNRDVGLSWLTRGVMYSIVPTMLLPICVSVVTGEFNLMPDYVWRAAILVGTVSVISTALLRSREHDADLRAATLMHDPNAMIALVGQSHSVSGGWWRQLRANHPAPAARADILKYPHRAASVGFVDGMAPAFLAASAMPLINVVATALSTANPIGPYQDLVAPSIGGVLLGCTVGTGVWRVVAVDRAAAAIPSLWAPACGVAVGLLLGQVVSLANTTSVLRGGLAHPAWLAIPALAGLASTVLVYSVAEVCFDATARLRSPRWAWIPGIVISCLVYFAVLNLSQRLQLTLDKAPWAFTRNCLIFELDSWPVVIAATVAAAMTGTAIMLARPGTHAPTWLFDESKPTQTPWPTASGTLHQMLLIGAVCGTCALIPYAVYRNRAPNDLNATSLFTLLEVSTWCGATGGAAAVVALILCVPRRGVALGMLAGTVAVLIFVIGFWVINAADDAPTHLRVVASMLADVLGLFFLLGTIIAPLALIPRLLDWRTGRTVAFAAALALTTCTGAILVSTTAEPVTEADLILGDIAPTVPESLAARMYVNVTGKRLSEGLFHTYGALKQIAPLIPTGDSSDLAQSIRSTIVQPLTALAAEAQTEHPRSPTVAAVHADAITLIATLTSASRQLADALEANDYRTVAEAMAELDQSSVMLDRWIMGMEYLRALAAK